MSPGRGCQSAFGVRSSDGSARSSDTPSIAKASPDIDDTTPSTTRSTLSRRRRNAAIDRDTNWRREVAAAIETMVAPMFSALVEPVASSGFAPLNC
jgi:hypothetical protein